MVGRFLLCKRNKVFQDVLFWKTLLYVIDYFPVIAHPFIFYSLSSALFFKQFVSKAKY